MTWPLAIDEIELAFSEMAEAIDFMVPVGLPYIAVLAATEADDSEADACKSAALYWEDAESRILFAGDFLVLPTTELAEPRTC